MRHSRTFLRLLLIPAATLAFSASWLSAQVSCNRFDVKTELETEAVRVSLFTDLPQDSRVVVSISRRYWRRGERGVFLLEYYNREMPVKGLTRPILIDLSDSVKKTLVEKINEARRFAGRGPVSIERVDEDFKLRVSLTMSQPNKAFGENNSRLSGEMVRQRGAYRGVRINKFFTLKEVRKGKREEKVRPRELKRVKAHAFEAGKIYVARKSVPVMNYHETGEVPALRKVGTLARQKAFLVDRIEKKGDVLWYRVAGLSGDGQGIGALGWAKAFDFGRRKHREEESSVLRAALERRHWLSPQGKVPNLKITAAPTLHRGFPNHRVLEATAVLPEGLKAEEARRLVCSFAWDLLEAWQGDACRVLLIRQGDSRPGAGQGCILPAAVPDFQVLKEEHLEAGPAGDLVATALIDKSYFERRPDSLPVGTAIQVKKEGSFEVHLHAEPTWKEGAKGHVRVARGTSGKIIAVRFLKLDKETKVRYQVEVEGKRRGWVDASQVFTF